MMGAPWQWRGLPKHPILTLLSNTKSWGLPENDSFASNGATEKAGASWGLPKTSNIGATLKYKILGAPCKKTLLPLMELKKCWGLPGGSPKHPILSPLSNTNRWGLLEIKSFASNEPREMLGASWGLPKTSNNDTTLKYKTVGGSLKTTLWPQMGLEKWRGLPKTSNIDATLKYKILGAPRKP